MKTRVLVVGAGGHGHVMLDVLQQQGDVEVVGFLDDRPDLLHTVTRGGATVIGTTDWDALPVGVADAFLVAIGDNAIRKAKFHGGCDAGLAPWRAVHPSAVIAGSAQLGEGTHVVARVVVNPFARVGRNVILNTACTVDHGCVVDDHAFIGPGVHLGGEVEVGEEAMLGLGAVVLPGITIGEGAVIGAGAVVTKDVAPWSLVVGVPAHFVRRVGEAVPEALGTRVNA